jgi:hypothetical protein
MICTVYFSQSSRSCPTIRLLCQDLDGAWEVVPLAEEFKVCRPGKGFTEVSAGFVQTLRVFEDKEKERGLLEPVMFDCAGGRLHSNVDVHYDSAGKITTKEPKPLGGAWELIKKGSKADAIRRLVCKDATK